MNYKDIANKLGETIAEVNLEVFPKITSTERMVIMGVLQRVEDVFLDKIRDITQVDIKENERE